MKVAIVYDRVNKYGGAERILEALHSLWPEAPLFTAVYDKKKAAWADVFEVRPSFLSRIPFANSYHEFLPLVTPFAFETMNFDGFDVVISVTSAEAKSIITKPGTLYICYCLTPTRYLWSGYEEYLSRPGLGILGSLAKNVLKRNIVQYRELDRIRANRPDFYIAISDTVKKRIETYYERNVEEVIYPPVPVTLKQSDRVLPKISAPYYLVVARLVGYKRVDIVIDAFTKLGWPLVVIGDGWERKKLMHLAGQNILFVRESLTDAELAGYYETCKAFVFAGVEDFGLVSVEAQQYGKPVIAYRYSGMSETIVDGKTGLLFDEQTSTSLMSALKKFERMQFNTRDCQKNAEKFVLERFTKRFYDCVHRLYISMKKGSLSL
jgi:glycosyltransferase involved in cell wall biosynthesis